MTENTVLILWLVTVLGGIGVLAIARLRAGRLPKRLGAPGGVVALHGALAVAGLGGWFALVRSDSPGADVPWLFPALVAAGVVALGLGIMWRAHHSQLHEEVVAEFDDEPLLDHVPRPVGLIHGGLGLLTAVGALWVALS